MSAPIPIPHAAFWPGLPESCSAAGLAVRGHDRPRAIADRSCASVPPDPVSGPEDRARLPADACLSADGRRSVLRPGVPRDGCAAGSWPAGGTSAASRFGEIRTAANGCGAAALRPCAVLRFARVRETGRRTPWRGGRRASVPASRPRGGAGMIRAARGSPRPAAERPPDRCAAGRRQAIECHRSGDRQADRQRTGDRRTDDRQTGRRPRGGHRMILRPTAVKGRPQASAGVRLPLSCACSPAFPSTRHGNRPSFPAAPRFVPILSARNERRVNGASLRIPLSSFMRRGFSLCPGYGVRWRQNGRATWPVQSTR